MANTDKLKSNIVFFLEERLHGLEESFFAEYISMVKQIPYTEALSATHATDFMSGDSYNFNLSFAS